jgi:predicted MPP superfamily phosphohydrolase
MPFAILAHLAGVLVWSLIAVGAAGLLCVAYGTLIERTWYRRSSYRVEAMPAASIRSLTILHISDTHMLAGDHRKAAFLASLPQPDVCVVTGDILGEPGAVETCVDALRSTRGRLASYFVMGSNDYYAPQPLNYLSYFRPRRRHRAGQRSRSEELRARLEADGWIYLANRKVSLSHDGTGVEVVGLDDPHIERHDLRVAPRESPDSLGLAVVHSPDPVPELAALGYDLILCGHTHGGQVRMPFVGALVTNSTIPTRLCMGLSRFGRSYLHVSPGLGTSKYAPFRFLCRPEATVLEVAPRTEVP